MRNGKAGVGDVSASMAWHINEAIAQPEEYSMYNMAPVIISGERAVLWNDYQNIFNVCVALRKQLEEHVSSTQHQKSISMAYQKQ